MKWGSYVHFVNWHKIGIVTDAVWKSPTKIGIIVPEIEGPPAGVQDITVQLSFNDGQQFSGDQIIKYLCFDPEMEQADRLKLEEETTKNIRAAKGKK